MKFSEVVKQVIKLATAINDYWEAELPKHHPKYPIVEPGAEDPPPPPQEEELRQFLLSRPATEVYKLLALADVGRGFPAFNQRWQEYINDAPEVQWAIGYLIGTVPLADYLESGLARLSTRNISVDADQPVAV
jgi:hypothetical protein